MLKALVLPKGAERHIETTREREWITATDLFGKQTYEANPIRGLEWKHVRPMLQLSDDPARDVKELVEGVRPMLESSEDPVRDLTLLRLKATYEETLNRKGLLWEDHVLPALQKLNDPSKPELLLPKSVELLQQLKKTPQQIKDEQAGT